MRHIQSGSAVSRSFAILGEAFLPLTALVALIELPLLGIGLATVAIAEAGGLEGPAFYAYVGGAGLLGLFLAPLSTAVVTPAVIAVLRGQPASFAESFRAGIDRTWPLLGVALLAALAIVAGLIALIVPGLIIACALFVAAPVAVVERVGAVRALERSWQLTKGSRWAIFGIAFAIGFIENVASKAVDAVFEAMQQAAPSLGVAVVAALVVWGVQLAGQLVLSVATAVTYYDLRRAKEAWTHEADAEVFD